MPIKLLPREDDSSGETEYLENLTQEYKKIEKRGPPIYTETKVTQDLIWGPDRIEFYSLKYGETGLLYCKHFDDGY